MSTKHTPGPWKAVGVEHIEAAAIGEIVAHTYDWQGEGERMANCRLLASAPDLLQFAINVALAIEENGEAVNLQNILADANEAIAKAQAE